MLYRWWRKFFLFLLLGIALVVLLNSSWFLKLFYPYPHEELVKKYCQEYHVDPYLVLAVIRAESSFKAQAFSVAGARGLMQIMPDTGVWIAKQMKLTDFTEEKLWEPDYNIRLGIWYLSYLDRIFNGETPKMLAAYNAGEQKVRRWLNDGIWSGSLSNTDQIPYAETRNYIDRVLLNYQVYRRIYHNDSDSRGAKTSGLLLRGELTRGETG